MALREREKSKVWLWRAYDPVARRTLAWELGGRDDATCRRLLDKVGLEGRIFLTDDWDSVRLVAHELCHQWFGNSLTVASWRDIWLHEGFACYSEWLWSEESGGPSADERATEH